MSSRVNHKRLQTIADVRAERVRVNRAIRETEQDLQWDWERFGDYFTTDYWLGAIFSQVSNVASASPMLANMGINLVATLIRRFRANKEERIWKKAERKRRKRMKKLQKQSMQPDR